MKRTAHLILVWLLSVLPMSAAARAPNILFLLSDDQRFDTIHALGNAEIQTPNLDRLVTEGFAFTHAYIMGSMVGAVCVPSRAMLMTGRGLFHATLTPTSNAIPKNTPLWPEVLRQQGYRTIGLGKWHNDRASFSRAFAAGGPIFFGGMSDHSKMAVYDYDPKALYAKTNARTAVQFSTELFADSAIRFLRAQREQPFCLYVAFTAPHDPRTPPKEFADLYSPEKMALPKSFLPEHPFDNGEMRVRDEKLLPWPRTPEAVRGEIAAYFGMISHLDAQVGRILEALEQARLRDSTIIVFAGDNGLAVGRHGLLGKQNLYEHSVRVPLIFSGPTIPKGKRSAAFCYLFDVFPTLCDLAGVATPASVEGRSLAPIIRGRTGQGRDSIFAAYGRVQRMIRDEQWKLISYPKLDRCQLFHVSDDPDELRDLGAEPKFAPKLAELKIRLAAAQKNSGDPLAPEEK